MGHAAMPRLGDDGPWGGSSGHGPTQRAAPWPDCSGAWAGAHDWEHPARVYPHTWRGSPGGVCGRGRWEGWEREKCVCHGMWACVLLALALVLGFAVRHCAPQRNTATRISGGVDSVITICRRCWTTPTRRISSRPSSWLGIWLRFVPFRSSCSPISGLSSEPGPGLDRGVYRRQGPVNRRRPPQFQPSGRFVSARVAWLRGYLVACFLACLALLQRSIAITAQSATVHLAIHPPIHRSAIHPLFLPRHPTTACGETASQAC